MNNILQMTALDLKHQRLLIREDFNVPMKNDQITDDTRIRAAIPTIEYALKQGAHIILMSHLGRPQEGQAEPQYSLNKVAERLSQLLKHPVRLQENALNGVIFDGDEIILCENVRFNQGEQANDPALAKKMASLADIFVMDAFATAHRTQASTHGVACYAKIACAGPLLVKELQSLTKALENPTRPLVAIVGGAKVSTKLKLLKNLLSKVDQLIVGGGIANTLLAASGLSIGQSLCETSMISTATSLLQVAKQENTSLPLPQDVIVAHELDEQAKAWSQAVNDINNDEMILDIGPNSAKQYAEYIQKAGTIIWNGPLGVFELAQFAEGTKTIAHAIAHSQAYSLAGGGDTIAAIGKFGVRDKISYISTGGGAFLAFLQGETLPALQALQNNYAKQTKRGH